MICNHGWIQCQFSAVFRPASLEPPTRGRIAQKRTNRTVNGWRVLFFPFEPVQIPWPGSIDWYLRDGQQQLAAKEDRPGESTTDLSLLWPPSWRTSSRNRCENACQHRHRWIFNPQLPDPLRLNLLSLLYRQNNKFNIIVLDLCTRNVRVHSGWNLSILQQT